MNQNIINISNYRGLAAISGDDRQNFLQGIISNDAKNISQNSLLYAFLLTPQGKFIFDLLIFEHNQKYYIEVEKPRVEELIKKLLQYKLRSKIEIIDASTDFIVGHSFEENFTNSFAHSEIINYLDPRHKSIGSRVYITESQAQNTNFISDNIADYNLYKQNLIQVLVPENSTNFNGDFEVESSYPLQYRMIENNGVDFKKGCYVGQEVTARTNYRGTIRKTIFCAKINEQNPLQIQVQNLKNADVFFENIKIGTVLNQSGDFLLLLLEIEPATQVKNQQQALTINNLQANI
jgi:tRNA-modifying protein YgfZ